MVTTSTKGQVIYDVSDRGLATVTLSRPTVLNAISLQMREELRHFVLRAEKDVAVRAMLFVGSGDRAFCVGADITEFTPPESMVSEREARAQPTWNDFIASSRKPTIASIHGFCLGGGLELALSCDIRIAAENSIFGLPEVGLGIIPGAGGTQRLTRVVGIAQALRLILSAQRINADEALRIGLVSQVVPTAELTTATAEWTDRLLDGAPRAIAYAKQAIIRGSEVPLPEGLQLEADLATLLMSTSDRVEGASAFRDRRKPRFTGN